MKQLTQRQYNIYDFIRAKSLVSNSEIKKFLAETYDDVSRITIVRDIEVLINEKLIKKEGEGRSTKYRVYMNSSLLSYFDPQKYFLLEPDNREVKKSFNFNIFNDFSDIFSLKELKNLAQLTKKYTTNISSISPDIFKKEIERLTIELSWKSSQIEGNTYSLLDTEALIKENREAPGHSKEEAIMILNHKTALNYVFSSKIDYLEMSVRKIEDIHALLVQNLSVGFGVRNSLVSITGTNYRPLDNKQQIQEALESSVGLINAYEDPFHKALVIIALISYIQPFVDGNKRTARLAGNAILNAFGACPLSYRSVDSVEYKKAMLFFYEQNSIAYLKELFIQQYEFSVNNYFLV